MYPNLETAAGPARLGDCLEMQELNKDKAAGIVVVIAVDADNTSSEGEGDANKRPAIFRSTVHKVLFVLTVTISVAMPSFLQGGTLIVSASIKRDLNITTSQLT